MVNGLGVGKGEGEREERWWDVGTGRRSWYCVRWRRSGGREKKKGGGGCGKARAWQARVAVRVMRWRGAGGFGRGAALFRADRRRRC